MKKLLIISLVSVVSLHAAWWDDLSSSVSNVSKAIQSPEVQAQIQATINKYGPMIAEQAKAIADRAQMLFANLSIPTDLLENLIKQGQRIIQQAGAIIQAQLQNNSTLIKSAQALLASQQKELDLLKQQAITLSKNPAAKEAIMNYINYINEKVNMIIKNFAR